MDVHFRIEKGNLVAILAGEIDHHVADYIKNSVEKELDKTKSKNLIFDFTKVTFMDSSGIGMIIGRFKLTEKQGGKTVVIGLSDNVKKLFSLSGLSKIIKTYDSLEQCIQDL